MDERERGSAGGVRVLLTDGWWREISGPYSNSTVRFFLRGCASDRASSVGDDAAQPTRSGRIQSRKGAVDCRRGNEWSGLDCSAHLRGGCARHHRQGFCKTMVGKGGHRAGHRGHPRPWARVPCRSDVKRVVARQPTPARRPREIVPLPRPLHRRSWRLDVLSGTSNVPSSFSSDIGCGRRSRAGSI